MPSDIENYLSQIRTAVYGRDVRDAIVNSIEQCYTDTSTGVTAATEAAETAADHTTAAINHMQTMYNALEDGMDTLMDQAESAISDANAAATAAQTAGTALSNNAQDIVLVQQNQPTNKPYNKVWVKPQVTEVEVPTYEEFSDLKSALTNTNDLTLTQTTNNFEWESGEINTSGVNSDNPARCRMAKSAECAYYKSITTPATLEMVIGVYSGNGFDGFYTGAAIAQYGAWLQYADMTNAVLSGKSFRVILRLKSTPTADIDSSVGNTVVFLSNLMDNMSKAISAYDHFALVDTDNVSTADYNVSIVSGTTISYSILNQSPYSGWYTITLLDASGNTVLFRTASADSGNTISGTFTPESDCAKIRLTNTNSRAAHLIVTYSDDVLNQIFTNKQNIEDIISKDTKPEGQTVNVNGTTDGSTTNYYVYESIPKGCRIKVVMDSTSTGFRLYARQGLSDIILIDWLQAGKTYVVTTTENIEYLRCFVGANATVKCTIEYHRDIIGEIYGSDVHVVGSDYDFATIQAAVDAATDGDTILIMPGTYREAVSAWAKELHFIGLDKDSCIVIDSKADYNAPPFEISHGSLQNLTIIEDATDTDDTDPENVNTAYCVHIEHPAGANHTLLIENCIMKNANRPCLGIGLQQDFTLTIRNCDMYSGVHVAGPAARGAVYFHTKNAENYTGQKISIQNCKIVCADTVAMTIMPLQNGQGSAEFINNMIYSEINGKQNTAIWNGSNQNCFDSNFTLTPTSYGNTVPMLNAE